MGILGSLAATARDPSLRRIEIASVAFNVAEWATWVAMLVYAYERGGAVASSVVAVVQLVPSALLAPIGATFADRYPRVRVLTIAYLAQAAAMSATAVALALDAPIAIVYALAACAASSMTLTRPAQNGLLPTLSSTPEVLTSANAALSAIENASIVVGPALAGVLLSASGAGIVFALMAAWLAASALIVSGVRAPEVLPAVNTEGTGDQRSALRVIAAQPQALLLIGLLAAQQLQVGALDVLFVALALSALDIGETGVGLLTSAVGLGGILGAVAAAGLARGGRLSRWMAVGGVIWGAGLIFVAPVTQVLVVFALVIVAGAGRGLMDVTGRTLLQRTAPPRVLARAFGVLEGLIMAALAVGAGLAAFLVDRFGPAGAVAVVGAVLPVVLLFGLRPLLRLDRTPRGAEITSAEGARARRHG